MRNVIERLKRKYDIASDAQLSVIVGTFSMAGMTDSLAVKSLLGSPAIVAYKMPTWLYVCTYIMIAVPLYQVFLSLYGFLFGQSKFFTQRRKQLGESIGKLFKKLAGK